MRSVVKKALRLVAVLFAVTAFAFLMVNLLPGDVAHVVAGEDATPEQIEAIRKDLGLHHGLVVRYFHWVGSILLGDWGVSYLTHEPVWDIILPRLPVTIELVLLSQGLALLLALPSGMASAFRNGKLLDRVIGCCGFATLSVPSFVMALFTIYLFSIRLGWLPATGFTPLSEGLTVNLKSLVLPSLSIALIEWVVLMRVLRSDMISTLRQNFILMARAKGLPPRRVLLTHALRPSSYTFITIYGIQVGRLLGEAVIVETIFALPGVGRLLVTSIYSRDYLVVQGCIVLITIGYVAVNSIVDMLYILIDPRIRSGDAHD